MNFADYYHASFRDDLSDFMRGRSLPYFGHAWRIGCPDLERVHVSRRPAFVVCLYFTVLMDQAMHAHFSSLHPRFEQLTRSPKFCHGLGQFHLNPRAILSAPIEHGLVGQEDILKHLAEGMRTLVSDMESFLRDHLPEIPPKSFFKALVSDSDVQIPLLIVMIDESVAESPAFKAYKALRHALSHLIKDLPSIER